MFQLEGKNKIVTLAVSPVSVVLFFFHRSLAVSSISLLLHKHALCSTVPFRGLLSQISPVRLTVTFQHESSVSIVKESGQVLPHIVWMGHQ